MRRGSLIAVGLVAAALAACGVVTNFDSSRIRADSGDGGPLDAATDSASPLDSAAPVLDGSPTACDLWGSGDAGVQLRGELDPMFGEGGVVTPSSAVFLPGQGGMTCFWPLSGGRSFMAGEQGTEGFGSYGWFGVVETDGGWSTFDEKLTLYQSAGCTGDGADGVVWLAGDQVRHWTPSGNDDAFTHPLSASLITRLDDGSFLAVASHWNGFMYLQMSEFSISKDGTPGPEVWLPGTNGYVPATFTALTGGRALLTAHSPAGSPLLVAVLGGSGFDGSFGDGGVVTPPVSASDGASANVGGATSDGAGNFLVVGGRTTSRTITLTKLLRDGTACGEQSLDLPSQPGSLVPVAFSASSATIALTWGSNAAAVIRVRMSGGVDPSFGDAGAVALPPFSVPIQASFAPDADASASLLVAGSSLPNDTPQISRVR